MTGHSLDALFGWQRNNYDRVVHFASGLLLSRPVRELIPATWRLRGVWSFVVPMSILISLATLFELIEWGAAAIFGGDLGMAYLGTQGDVWDAHRDMALAGLGALFGLTLDTVLTRERRVTR